ncbi:MAG TPA: hypothetical protein VEK85_17150 [Gemmatimonadales bacterium]|nr:hypothetical protein [Gemmatimonadales bacterium]
MPDGFDTLAGAHLDSAPAPSPQVDNLIAQAAADDAAAAGESGPIAGIPAGFVGPPGWDATLHVYPPRKTARRSWALLTRTEREARARAVDAADAPPPADADAQAQGTVDTVAAVVPLLGESWALDDGERARLTDALAAVYRKRGGVDVPPELALVGVLLSIALPRLLSTSWGARAVERLRVSLGATPAPPAPAAVEGRKRAA